MLSTAQLSLLVTTKVTLLVHTPGAALTLMLSGQLITGGCVSTTVTVKLQLAVLPLASVAVLVTVVTPTGKATPLAGLLTRLATAQLSLLVTTKVTLLVHTPGAALTLMLSGQL